MKLFAFYIGGTVANANVELHDMRFAVGNCMEDCYESLRQQWWGTPESLHIDCWMELTQGDDHSILLSPEPYPGPERLFFANLGGYDPAQFTELHSNVFVVASDKEAAKKRALATVRRWMRTHRDTLFEVEQIIGVSEVTEKEGQYIHLALAPLCPPPRFTTGCYIRLGA